MTRVAQAFAAPLLASCAARGAPPPLSPDVLRLAAELDTANLSRSAPAPP